MVNLLSVWRFATVMLTALSLGPALAHLLEMPAKIGFDGALWLELLHNLYPPGFGTAGALFEVGALVSALVLTLLVRTRRPALAWTALGTFFLAASHAAFWIWVVPVNAAMEPLTAETLPPNWTALRDQWEYTHAARAILQLMGLGALVISLLVENADNEQRRGTGPLDHVHSRA